MHAQVLQPKSGKPSGNVTTRSYRNKYMFAVQIVTMYMFASLTFTRL